MSSWKTSGILPSTIWYRIWALVPSSGSVALTRARVDPTALFPPRKSTIRPSQTPGHCHLCPAQTHECPPLLWEGALFVHRKRLEAIQRNIFPVQLAGRSDDPRVRLYKKVPLTIIPSLKGVAESTVRSRVSVWSGYLEYTCVYRCILKNCSLVDVTEELGVRCRWHQERWSLHRLCLISGGCRCLWQ